jgi:hypothetical protein
MVYFVREPFEVVLRPDPSTLGYITVMPGSTVTVLGEAEQSGTVRISYMDRIATASLGTSARKRSWWTTRRRARAYAGIDSGERSILAVYTCVGKSKRAMKWVISLITS